MTGLWGSNALGFGHPDISSGVASSASIPANSTGEVEVSCPAGTKVTGGGAFDTGVSTAYLYQSGPLLGGEGWEAFYKTGANVINATAFAICASP